MPVPGGSPGSFGGMQSQSGEVSEELSKMMGGASGTTAAGSTSAQASTAAQQAQAQAMQAQNGGIPGGLPGADQKQQPREVGSIAEEAKRGIGDIFKGLKEFFSLHTWLGIDANKLDPQQQAHAAQVHQRFQQLDQEQRMVAQKMYEEKMQKKRIQEEEAHRRRQIEAEEQAQSVEMPSSPQKGAPSQGGSKKQRTMTKLKQDRTTLSNVQGE